MARQPTHDQAIVLDRLQSGEPLAAEDFASWDGVPLDVLSCQWSVLPDHLVAHRTVRTNGPPGSRTELFRIWRDGRVTEH